MTFYSLSLSLSLSIHRIVSQTVDVIIHVGCRYNSGVEGPEILVVTLIYFSDSHLRRNVRNRENSAGNRRRRVRLVWSQSEKTNNSRCSSRYVGSHCVVELLKEDFNVICIDNFVNCQRGHEYPESISRVQDLTGKQVTFYEADITSKDSLRQVNREAMPRPGVFLVRKE